MFYTNHKTENAATRGCSLFKPEKKHLDVFQGRNLLYLCLVLCLACFQNPAYCHYQVSLNGSGETFFHSGGNLNGSEGTLNGSGGILNGSQETLNGSGGISNGLGVYLNDSGETLSGSGGTLNGSAGISNGLAVSTSSSGETLSGSGLTLNGSAENRNGLAVSSNGSGETLNGSVLNLCQENRGFKASEEKPTHFYSSVNCSEYRPFTSEFYHYNLSKQLSFKN